MGHRQPVEDFPVYLPIGHELIHQGYEMLVMGGFHEMHHLMDHQVFQAFAWFLRQLAVEPDAAGGGIAAAPPGFHPLHVHLTHLNAHDRFPVDYQRRHRLPELIPIPGLNNLLLLFLAGSGPDLE